MRRPRAPSVGARRARVIDPATRAFAAAVDAVLAPQGYRQRGHTLAWIGDRGFWLAIAKVDVEERRVSVGGHWLWFLQPRWCFDFGERFSCDPAKPQEAALRAAEELSAIRSRYSNVAAIRGHLAEPADQFWPLYHAGLAAGLIGDAGAAQKYLAQLVAKPAARDWEEDVSRAAAALLAHLPDLAAFRRAVGAIIAETRALQGLPAIAAPFG